MGTYLERPGDGASSSPPPAPLFLLLLNDASSLLCNPPAALPRLDLFFAITLSLGALAARLRVRSR